MFLGNAGKLQCLNNSHKTKPIANAGDSRQTLNPKPFPSNHSRQGKTMSRVVSGALNQTEALIRALLLICVTCQTHTLNPEPYTLNPNLSKNPKPYTLNPQLTPEVCN